tara:strand:+ start:2483 stop:3361 length:879 start_codon:yes stop_codon:yes gene_type:complete
MPFAYLRPLEPVALARDEVPAPDCGPLPELRWLPVAQLVIDKRYQRDIETRGRRNIRHIVTEFQWSRFTPLVVARVTEPRAGVEPLYAIIDGQHRATAALTHGGITKLPCQIVTGELNQLARAYIGINTAVTKMHPLQIHAAGVTAGDPDALHVDAITRQAGVTVCKYPVTRRKLKRAHTMSPKTIARVLAMHGDKPVRVALTALAEADRAGEGSVNQDTIAGLVMVTVALGERTPSTPVARFLSEAISKRGQENLLAAAREAALRGGGSVARHYADQVAALIAPAEASHER